MKHLKRILSIVIVLAVMASCLVFANVTSSAFGVNVSTTSITVDKSKGTTCTITASLDTSEEGNLVYKEIVTSTEWLSPSVTSPATWSGSNGSYTVNVASVGVGSSVTFNANARFWGYGVAYTGQHTDLTYRDRSSSSVTISVTCSHTNKWVLQSDTATCTSAGTKSYRCSVCGATKSESSSALGHSYTSTSTDSSHLKSAATCTAKAVYYKSCSRCGANGTETFESGNALGHNPGAAATCTTAQTCTRCGATLANALGHNPGAAATCTTAQTCTRCGATLANALGHNPGAAATCTTAQTCTRCGATIAPATGHTPGDWVTLTPATCTSAGSKEKRCTVCNTLLATDTIPATGHTPVTDAAVAPTCTETGLTQGSHCSVCNAVIVAQETVAALGHNYVATVTAPTCTQAGYTTYTCSRCGDSYVDDNTEALGHTWNEGVVTTEPTCTETGIRTFTCTVCGATTTDVIPIDSNAHNWGAWTTTTAATCTTAGEEERVCTLNSAHTETRSIPIDNDAHDWGDWVETTPATCTATGVETRTCRHNAEHTQTRDIPIDSSNHNYQLTGTVQPTCTEGGYDIYTCSRCGDVQHQNPTAATGHSYTVEDPSPAFLRTAATCTDAATYYKKCANCGASSHSDGTDTYFTYGSVNASNHDYQFTRTVAPTCTAQGYDLYTCANGCGSTEQRNLVVANGHTFTVQDHTSEFLRTPATCTAAATYYYKCAKCGESSHIASGDDSYYSYGEVEPTAHDFQFTEKVASTCTEDGYDLYTCSRCPATEHRNTTSALGHNFEFTRRVAPTCLEGGYDIYTCSRCDATENRNLTSATGHSWGEWEVTTAPGCLTTGEETRVCNNDSSHTETREVDALGHDYVGTITTQPTCTLAGERTYECSRCDASYTESVAALGHDYQDVVTPPTCTEDGYTTHTCSRCDASYIDTTVAATGHDFQKTSTVPPTCTEGGYDVYTCANGCGATENRNSVAATGHAWGEWTQTVAPTCTEAGSETRVCANDNSHTETQAVAALGHDITGVEWEIVTPPTTSSTGLKVKRCTRCGTIAAEEVIPVLSGPAVEDLEIYPDGGSVLIGGTLQLTPVITPANATNKNVLWESSNTSVALVSSSGLVTGVTAGTVTITARAQDNQTILDTVTVTVVSSIAQVGYIQDGRHYNGISSGAATYITPESCYTLQYQTTYTPSEFVGNGATLTPTLAFYSTSDGTTPVTMAAGTKITLIDYTLTGAPKYYYYMCNGSETSLPITSFTRMQYLTPFAVKTGSSQITEKLIFVVDYADATTTPSSLSPKLHYNFTTD